jgi:hypothetical protein
VQRVVHLLCETPKIGEPLDERRRRFRSLAFRLVSFILSRAVRCGFSRWRIGGSGPGFGAVVVEYRKSVGEEMMGRRACGIFAKTRPVDGRSAWRLFGCLVTLSLLAACSQEEMLQKFTSPEEQATAKQYIDQLRSHNFAEIEKSAAPGLTSASLESALTEMAALIPSDPPVSVRLVGAHRYTSTPNGTTVNIIYEYQFPDRFVLANVAIMTKNGETTVVGLHVQPEATSLESRNRFTLSGKNAMQCGVLVSAVAAALFTLAVLVVCAKRKMKRRKWLWILFILLGFGKLSVNWTTGQWGIAVLAAQPFSASAVAALYGPWMVSVSLPVGAIVFLIYRRRLTVMRQIVTRQGRDHI